MKKLFLLTAVLFAAVSSYAQAISQLPLYSGNPAGGMVPVVISNATRRVDASSFGYTKLDTAFLRNDSMFISKYGQTFYVGKFSGATSLNGNGLVKMTGTTPSYITDNSGNWTTAFGWGNHASAGYENTANKGIANGYVPLNGATKIDPSYLPSGATTYKGTWNASTNTPTLSDGSGTAGWTYTVSVGGTQNLGSGSITWSVGDQAIHNGTVYQRSPSGAAVASVNSKVGTVVIDKNDVALGNADNTSDANKPISTATQTALDAKVAITRQVNGHALSSDVSITNADVGLGNVDNTSDASKPVSTPQATALNLKVDKVNGKGLSTEDYTTTEKSKLSNQSGTNTGDQTLNGLLPSQTGNSGKALLTDGTNASWQTVSGGSSSWGGITGTLASQTDLQTALDAKQGIAVKQVHTSGATITPGNTTTWLVVNPASTLATLAVTAPASPTDAQTVMISFGGTITSGNVVTSFSFVANSGQTVLQAYSPTSVEAGETVSYRYNSTNTKWYRVQ